ncbi:MAG: segregation/condensation protein A [Myxococcota bacterium]
MSDQNAGAPSVSFEPLVPESGASYAVKLPVFEGPLDLLLHLIRLNEVDVADIPITRIAEQYLEYIDLMQELDLDVAGEYLLMAATLAWIKSRMLLPAEPAEGGEEPVDPRAELAARLLEYQRFKEAAGALSELPRLGREVFRPVLPGPAARPDGEREIEVGLFELLRSMRTVLEQARARDAVHQVESEPITVRERMVAVMEGLGGTGSMEFFELFRDGEGRAASLAVVVATFLAILELARLGAIRVFQGVCESGAPQGPIRLRATGDELRDDWVERISELM